MTHWATRRRQLLLECPLNPFLSVFRGLPGFLFVLLRRFQFKAWFGILQSSILIQLQLHSFTLKQKLFSEESCSVVGLSENMSFQLRSELSATVERWAEVRWKCVPDDRSRDGEASLADGRVCPQNEQIAAISRTDWPTWRFRNRPNGLLEVDRTGTSDTVEGQSSNLKLYPCSDWQPMQNHVPEPSESSLFNYFF